MTGWWTCCRSAFQKGVSAQGRRITVRHLLTMTAGHAEDSLLPAWELEPHDLVKGFLRLAFDVPEGSRHTYDNSTTFALARMVERVSGQELPELLEERLFQPMGIENAEWDRVASGLAFGFHGLHLRTEDVAAFGELLLRGGRWGDRQLMPREWVELATSKQIETLPLEGWADDFHEGYGFQFWRSRHGYFGNGAFGQQCVVVPEHELVIAVTSSRDGPIPGIFWDCLLPGIDDRGTAEDDALLAERLRGLSLPRSIGRPNGLAYGTIKASDGVLPDGTPVVVEPADGGWRLSVGEWPVIEVGHNEWRESAPLGRPVVATGGWQGDEFAADVYVITSPHRVRLTVSSGKASAVWNEVPLTTPRLELHLRAPLMTRPDVS